MHRQQYWESVYSGKAPDTVSWYQAEPTWSLALIERSGIEPGEPVIDVGGGASVLVDRLLEQGFTALTVLDVSARALAHARSRLAAAGETVEWVAGDVLEFRSQQPYALWHDRAVLHFLTEPSDQARYAEVLRATLRPDGRVIIATFAVGGPMRCSGLDIVQYDATRLCALLGPEFELEEESSEMHLTPAGNGQAFTWFRLRRLS